MSADPAAILAAVTEQWRADPDSAVVWCGDHEGRRGVRMAQECRDFTTVWFDVGQRTMGYEAYVAPLPPRRRDAVFALLLDRNRRGWRVSFAIDPKDGIVVRGRIPLERVDAAELDAILGAVYEAIETTFRPILRLGFGRENNP